MDDEEFRTAFRKSLMKRAKRSGLARNAAVVLANTDDDTDRVLSI
jgi:epoxyqueuosine reductase QueG